MHLLFKLYLRFSEPVLFQVWLCMYLYLFEMNGSALHMSAENRSPKKKLSDCKMFENAAVLLWEDEKRKFRRR